MQEQKCALNANAAANIPWQCQQYAKKGFQPANKVRYIGVTRFNTFGKIMVIKALGVSSFIYSASSINVTKDTAVNVKLRRLFIFMCKNKRNKTKRAGLYQNDDNGGLGVTDIETIIEALRLAWTSKVLRNGQSN